MTQTDGNSIKLVQCDNCGRALTGWPEIGECSCGFVNYECSTCGQVYAVEDAPVPMSEAAENAFTCPDCVGNPKALVNAGATQVEVTAADEFIHSKGMCYMCKRGWVVLKISDYFLVVWSNGDVGHSTEDPTMHDGTCPDAGCQ